MDIKTAREMLAAATLERKCDHDIYQEGCEGCDQLWRLIGLARDKIRRLGFTPAAFAAYILAVEALKDRCWHRELYEERSDGASDIYPSIMHEDKCSDETTCEPCGACKALAAWEAL